MKTEKESNDKLIKMATTGAPLDPDKAIAQAKKNLEVMKDGYVKNMSTELSIVEKLIEAYLNETHDTAKIHRELNTRLHELKATADTFGYTLITDIAGSLGCVFSLASPSYRIPEKILRVHLDSFKIVQKKTIVGAGGEAERDLIEKLINMTDAFIEKTKNNSTIIKNS